MNKFILRLVFGISLLLPTISLASEYANISEIYPEIQDFLYSELSGRYHGTIIIKPSKLDNRFKLRACEQPYEYELPARSQIGNRTTIIVSCPHPAWSMYMPVNVAIYNDAVLTRRPLSRGEIVGPEDLDIQKVNITSLTHGFFNSIDEVVGLSATQNIKANTIMKPRLITKPIVINRGDLISIIGQANGFEVRTTGKSLSDGTMGSSIQVRNTASKRIIEGIVAGHGKVIISRR